MTPQAESAFNSFQPREKAELLRNILSGAQFFDCSALEEIIELRQNMPGDWHCSDEIIQCELPSENTWIDLKQRSIGISRMPRGELYQGRIINLVGCAFVFKEDGTPFPYMHNFMLFEDGEIGVWGHEGGRWEKTSPVDFASMSINTAWYCIEAMQTPGGLCHAIEHGATRQQVRAAKRTGRPCHKWIEIRLGRGQGRGGIASERTGKTVAWHYRRGHKINHPNPNFPKWRKGCWVGDTDAGIRTHNYVVEVPE